MVRPYWSGRIQISLVSFGVELYVATEAKAQISFNQISRTTGERIRHQKVLQSSIESSIDGTPAPGVQRDEIVKGYEYRKGEYIIIENSELENLRVPSKHTVEVTQFVHLDELSPEYVEKPYFVVPEKNSHEAFAVVRKALQNTGKVAIGKIAFSGREHVLAVAPTGDGDRGGMMAYTLRYTSELRDQSDYFRNIKHIDIASESLELAEVLIAKRSAKLDLSKFEDGYEAALKELVEAKVNHLPVPMDEGEQPRRNVVNLMDALRKSIATGETGGRPDKKPAASAKSEPKKDVGLVKAKRRSA
jgi:DNA end-binding protein Ku